MTLLEPPIISTRGISGKLDKSKDMIFTLIELFPPWNSKILFDEISQLVQSALDGYKVCMFAHDQTGSG